MPEKKLRQAMRALNDRVLPETAPSHPLPAGFTGPVIAVRLFREPYIEGLNFTIGGPVPGVPDFYWGRFEDDPAIRERYVFEEHKADPEHALAVKQAEWLAGMPAEILEEFFPHLTSSNKE